MQWLHMYNFFLLISLVENLSKSLDGPIAKISSNGKLETFGRLGFGMILVNVADSPSSPKQHISLTFEVLIKLTLFSTYNVVIRLKCI